MKTMTENWGNSYLFGNNADFIEELYDQYLANPATIDVKWKKYFDSLQDGARSDVSQSDLKEKFAIITQKPILGQGGDISEAQAKVWQLIQNYRKIGVMYADLDPLLRAPRIRPKALDLDYCGLRNELENEFYPDFNFSGSKLKLKDIVAKFEAVYCNKISFEFIHITELTEFNWLTEYVENKYTTYTLSSNEKLQILEKLTEAEGLERYLHTKYVGQKRFSLEGGESLIPALDRILSSSAKNGVSQLVIGMAHRGRLNTLVNIAGKSPKKLFDEFDGNYPHYDFVTSGDVKYHKGYKCTYVTPYGKIKTTLAYNPSHLEVVNPVVNGIVRAEQDMLKDMKESVLGVLIHGDSALIGLGTNQGVFNMCQTRAYNVYGMIHIVVNNQVGFTTSDLRDARSSAFCTDIAKMIEVPIIHVNADDLASVAFAMDLAIDYRTKFKKEVMIELVCFRRHGHNETDDPSQTQPYMYSKVKQHPGTRKVYADYLIANGLLKQEDADNMLEAYRLGLNQGVHVHAETMEALPWYDKFDVKPVLKAKPNDVVTTNIDLARIAAITEAVTTLPDANFKLHPTVARLVENRKSMGKGDILVDFGMAETLAYGSLLQDGVSVHLSGEDSGRGTFSHRHAVWHAVDRDDLSDSGYTPLSRLATKSQLTIYDSILNEECVLGFEYGYSTVKLKDLVIWEAQFGDFANGAQVIIDQFIASAETKWGTLSSITLMLPHGYDGQGPEHSSARVERYLQLCAENNMQVVIPSTAAQMFHLLRHKALTNYIKPLVICMSKRLLRYKEAMSDISEFANGSFQTVIGDNEIKSNNTVTKVIVCTGQVYYDLKNARSERKLDNQVAIIRVEQLYPFPSEQLHSLVTKYTKATKFVWAQEEPYNQGAWIQIRDGLDAVLGDKGKFSYASREASAAPACGFTSMHNEQLKQLVNAAFA